MTADARAALMQSDCVGLLTLMPPHSPRRSLPILYIQTVPLAAYAPVAAWDAWSVQPCHEDDGEDDALFDDEQDEPAANGAQLLPIASATPTTVPATPTPVAASRSPAKRSSPRPGGQYGNAAVQVRELARAEASNASQAAKVVAVQAQIAAAGRDQQELAALRAEVAGLRADSDCRKEEQAKAEERAVVAAEMDVQVAAALNETIRKYTVEAAKHSTSWAISEPLVGASVPPLPYPTLPL